MTDIQQEKQLATDQVETMTAPQPAPSDVPTAETAATGAMMERITKMGMKAQTIATHLRLWKNDAEKIATEPKRGRKLLWLSNTATQFTNVLKLLDGARPFDEKHCIDSFTAKEQWAYVASFLGAMQSDGPVLSNESYGAKSLLSPHATSESIEAFETDIAHVREIVLRAPAAFAAATGVIEALNALDKQIDTTA